jgi:hypothetical protein
MAHKIDTSHPYTRHEATDIRKTFARVLKQQKAAQAVAPAPTPAPTTPPAVEPSAVVRPLRKAKP